METLYDDTRRKITELAKVRGMTLERITKDQSINWRLLHQAEQENAVAQGVDVPTHWKRELIKRFTPPGRFKNGGDRRSSQWRAKRAHHQALIACVEERVLQAAPDVTEASLVEECLRTVQRRWRPVQESTGIIVERTVQVVVTATRRGGQGESKYTAREITTLRSFERTEIVDTRSTTEDPQPEFLASFSLPDLKQYDVTVQAEILKFLSNLSRDHTERTKAREETERAVHKELTERIRLENEPKRLREERLLLSAKRRQTGEKPKANSEAIGPSINEGDTPRLNLPALRAGLPEGARDLTMALVCSNNDSGTLRPEMAPLTPKEYTELAKMIWDGFVVPHAQTWAVLWARRPRRTEVIPTFLDTVNDPIVPCLRAWLVECLRVHREGGPRPAAPSYPVHPDPRPPPAVPEDLRAMASDEVWDDFCAVGLMQALRPYKAHYEASRGLRIEATTEPCAERLRQWARITQRGTGVPFGAVVDCLGWTMGGYINRKDTTLVQLLTQCLLGPNVNPATWYNHAGSQALWTLDVCLPAMRRSVVLVARLRAGGADLRFLASNIRDAPRGENSSGQ